MVNLKIKSWKCEGGEQAVYRHSSKTLECEMEYSIFLPSSRAGTKMPVLYFLSGLSCTWENAVTKGFAQRYADAYGIIIVFPDTSPRGKNVPDKPDDYSFGQGAGFYLNATQEPWNKNYRMYDYVVKELRGIINTEFEVDTTSTGITGHSMGGHGALTIAMKNPDIYQSVSAFAPIVNPMEVPWGINAFDGYLGNDKLLCAKYDACQLAKTTEWNRPILIDQGGADEFLGKELFPEKFMQVCSNHHLDLTLRYQGGYDHSYYFISTFMEDHLAWHAKQLH